MMSLSSSPMSAFTILNVEHGGRPTPAAPGLYVCTWPVAQSIKTSEPSRPPKASLAVDRERGGVRHDVAATSSAQRMGTVEFFFISSLSNVVWTSGRNLPTVQSSGHVTNTTKRILCTIGDVCTIRHIWPFAYYKVPLA